MGVGMFFGACVLFVVLAVNYPGWVAIGLFAALVVKVIVETEWKA